eukprot:UN15861
MLDFITLFMDNYNADFLRFELYRLASGIYGWNCMISKTHFPKIPMDFLVEQIKTTPIQKHNLALYMESFTVWIL